MDVSSGVATVSPTSDRITTFGKSVPSKVVSRASLRRFFSLRGAQHVPSLASVLTHRCMLSRLPSAGDEIFGSLTKAPARSKREKTPSWVSTLVKSRVEQPLSPSRPGHRLSTEPRQRNSSMTAVITTCILSLARPPPRGPRWVCQLFHEARPAPPTRMFWPAAAGTKRDQTLF